MALAEVWNPLAALGVLNPILAIIEYVAEIAMVFFFSPNIYRVSRWTHLARHPCTTASILAFGARSLAARL